MKQATMQLINNSTLKEQDGSWILSFVKCNFRRFGARLSVKPLAISINGVDIYDLDAEDIATDEMFFAFNQDLPTSAKEATYDEDAQELHIDGDIYRIINTDSMFFIGDFGGAKQKRSTKSLMNLFCEYLKDKNT